MRICISACTKRIPGLILSALQRLLANSSGNFAVIFALAAMPIIFALGASVDFVRAYNVRVEMQSNLDAALISAVKRVDSLDETQIKTQMKSWFDAQALAQQAKYTLSNENITVNRVNRTIQATATGVVSTTFLGIASIRQIDVSVASSVSGPATSYLNVYIVLDKSASMLLAADSAGQTAMNSKAGCVFACHISENSGYDYNNKHYSTNYDLAKGMGVKLRADVSVTAAKEVLDMIASSDPTGTRIRAGLYTIGSTATEVVAPTFSISTAKSALDDNSKGLNSATSQTTSRFDTTLPSLKDLVGAAGDGSTTDKPLKLVLLLTDGVVSQRDWVLNGVWWNSQGKMVGGTDWYKVAPLNPDWCTAMKTTNKVTVGVLYTEYLSIPTDEGYIHTVGETMSSAKWSTTWNGTMRSGISTSTKRRDYIPYALEDCASSKDMFISAADSQKIEAGLSSLFQYYIGSVRLTQ